MIKYGSKNERFQGLVGLASNNQIRDQYDYYAINVEVIPALLPIAAGVSSEDPNDRIWANIALAHIFHENKMDDVWIKKVNIKENTKNTLLDALSYFTQNPSENMSPLALLESEIVKALSLYKGDKDIIEGLTDALRSCSSEYDYARSKNDYSYLFVRSCLRAIGSFGDKSGKELLEYWRDKGYLAAKVAIELFGKTWEEIRDKEKEIEKNSKI